MALSGKGSLQVRSSEGCQTDHPRVWGGLKSNDWCPTETPRDAGAETGVTRPQARAHLPPPHPRELEQAGKTLPWTPEGARPFPDFDFERDGEGTNLCCSKAPVCGHLLRGPRTLTHTLPGPELAALLPGRPGS